MKQPYIIFLAAIAAGALQPLALAPFHLWPLSIVSCGLFAALLYQQDSKQVFLRSFAYALGLFGFGISWVYVSIHDYGMAPMPLAALMTFLFAAFLSSIFAGLWCLGRKYTTFNNASFIFIFPALWLIREWLHTWLLTGFPWLLIGTAHIDSPLAGWAPILGVLGLGFICAFSGVCLFYLIKNLRDKSLQNKTKIALGLCLCLWLSGALLQKVQWTQEFASPLKVALIQPNVTLYEKWDPRNHGDILQRNIRLSEALWQESDIILWPENAIPYLHHEVPLFLEKIQQRASETNTTWISGILTYNPLSGRFFNTLVSAGKNPQENSHYYKRRLVPFGEYVPLEDYFRGLIQFLDLPQSIIESGAWQQSPLQSASTKIAPLICYEITYPDLSAKSARGTNWLLTVSNDAWFNDSLAPQQHLQMAQMRALETQRPLLRGTNNGISAIVNSDGSLQNYSPQFKEAVIRGSIQPMSGNTPFMNWGSWPIVLLSLLLIAAGYLYRRDLHL